MNKWLVKRKGAWFLPAGEDEPCYGMRWCVTSPADVILGHYATWREAMGHADKLSRTITVTLPRTGEVTTIPTPPGKDGPVELTCETVNFYSIAGRKGLVGIFQQELQPLALALLAHHYKREAGL